MSKVRSLFARLFEPFSDDVKKTKSQGGQKITFVEWVQYVIRGWAEFPEGYSKTVTLVKEFGGVNELPILKKGKATGEFEVVDDRQLIVCVRITDLATGIHQDAMGCANAGKMSWGGAMAEAESQAFRRAMANFGMGLEMYLDDDEFGYAEERIAIQQEDEVPNDPEVNGEDPMDWEEDATDQTDSEADATPRQMEVLQVLGGLLAEHEPAKGETRCDDFLEEQRGILEDSFTLASAGAVIRRMRNMVKYYGLEDPTTDGGDN